MSLKKCTICKKDLDSSLFLKDSSRHDGLQAKCANCCHILSKKNYKENKERYKQRYDKRRLANAKWLFDYKSKLSCPCGENSPECLQFHHIDRNNKEFSISYMITRHLSKERMLKEIAKCIVLCGNCHAKLHHKERKKKLAY